MKIKKVVLPKDELPHKNQAIEWWYFNGFLEGKNKYSFMTCLFKADKDKVNLKFLRLPIKTLYFSHSLLFNLDTKKVEKEILPFVILSDDSFKSEELKINYFYPIRKKYYNYEISRIGKDMRIKTKYFDLMLRSNKSPLLEGGKGFIDLGEKSTYYYSYSNMSANGFVGKEKVSGIAWHDKQWSNQGFTNDDWIWFSIQMDDNTEIVCFNYKGKKMATISYKNNEQKTYLAEFEPIGTMWTSKKTGLKYDLEWRIKIKDFIIETSPIMKNCEMSFGFINYWEGPLKVKVNGVGAKGFMEYLAKQKPKTSLIKKIWEKYHP